MSGWIDEAKRVQASEVAPHVGIGHVRGRTVAPCPACGAERRGSKDRRGPVDLHERDGRELWHCKRCDTGGDALDMVSLVLRDRRFSDLDRDARDDVWRWYADRGLCEAPRGHRAPVVPPAPKAKRVPTVEAAPEYLPDGDAARFWSLCRPLATAGGTDIAPTFYLRDRGYDVRPLALLDVVRAVPESMEHWPGWFPAGRAPAPGRPDWRRFRLAFRAYTPDGELRGLHFRRVPVYANGQDDDRAGLPICEDCGGVLKRTGLDGPRAGRRVREHCAACGWAPRLKPLWPAGASAEGLLFADSGGVQVLRGDPQAPRRVLVVEGVTDLLRAATIADRVPCAVIGFTSGGASALGAIRWRPDAEVAIATDDDTAGERYADQATEAMRPLRPLRVRWADLVPAQGGDAKIDTDDALRAGGVQVAQAAFTDTPEHVTPGERAVQTESARKRARYAAAAARGWQSRQGQHAGRAGERSHHG